MYTTKSKSDRLSSNGNWEHCVISSFLFRCCWFIFVTFDVFRSAFRRFSVPARSLAPRFACRIGRGRPGLPLQTDEVCPPRPRPSEKNDCRSVPLRGTDLQPTEDKTLPLNRVE